MASEGNNDNEDTNDNSDASGSTARAVEMKVEDSAVTASPTNTVPDSAVTHVPQFSVKDIEEIVGRTVRMSIRESTPTVPGKSSIRVLLGTVWHLTWAVLVFLLVSALVSMISVLEAESVCSNRKGKERKALKI